METQRQRRVIEVRERVVGPTEPRLKVLHPRRLSDYPHVPAVYHDAARCLASAARMGPPICDELMALVQHLFTEEEAGVARHLRMYTGRTAAQLARAEHRPVEQIQPILDRLANEKRVIVSSDGKKNGRPPSYRMLPIMPGIFEMTLIACTPETMTDWHRRFIELFESLYETGYSLDYQQRHGAASVRFLPVGKAIDAHPMALPTDKLEVVLDQFKVFAVGQCQCRMAMQVLGRGCGKPIGNCMTMGTWAERAVESGQMKEVSRSSALQLKREAESHGMVNWLINVQSTRGQCSCSCCGCCCHAMRMINEFNAPGFIAPPHFLPRLNASRCIHCGKCAEVCPMGAIIVDMQQKKYTHLRERCIGCGLCALACDRQWALAMEPVPDYRLPYRSWFSMIAHALPGTLMTNWKVHRQRRSQL
jgi:Pyruvate/2-oxoacid:ferredoxin oxidoreductase delta subunit